MTELRCRKTDTLEGETEEDEGQIEAEVQTTDTKEPVNTEEDEGSVSSGGDGGNKQQKDEGQVKEKDAHKEEESNKPESAVKKSKSSSASVFLQRLVRVFFGFLAAVACGILYAAYLSAYHDRKFWFSTRQELERELTFQGGSGVYYYYYKHMLTVPSFERGFYELTIDNRTVSGQTINAVERLSLYPELITSYIYRVTDSQDFVEPIYFYVGAVFGLQAVYVTALFVCSWVMSGTWVAGMLAVAWYVINRPDTTKVDFAIPLRDNWALPYFSCQVAALTGFLSNNISSATEQKMKKGPFVARLMKLFLHFHLVFTTAITFSYLVKKLIPVSESDFILKFLEVKFGLNTTTDFITNFLLCQESFQTPSQDLFLRLTQSSVLPFYLLVLTVCLLSTLQTIYRRLSGQPMKTNVRLEDGRIGEQPEVIYHVCHTLLFGGLALLFDGMKYLWTPYVCMFTAFGVCSPDLWMTVFKWLKLKSIHPVVLSLILSTAVPTIIGFSLWREYCPRVLAELSDVQEFYDHDTVELINWIKSQAPVAAVFAGSPQLLGTVKLCSGSAVTSLPLYSDINLLRRTEDTYQVYALRSAEDIYKILTSQKTNYVIIEDSICNELSLNKGCRLKDLLDISNGHVIYDKEEIYSFSKHRRFCHEIKMNYSPYTNYFTRVFWNRSYHVYKVNTVISFQY
ncbi:probable C-mannosyltransferase DPY19L4 isoform X2 [Etheostoma spectabile]|uniref:probable C-mannosyltransferase DPY19L4 isoform X2 n=1 Tax=Etheostoma spectabile TaxID=54343 RepID=UPI0013AEE363|nr:probable C-mannosyltransferase DPY19L4 isoform X2 [Etheostoma spectabile]